MSWGGLKKAASRAGTQLMQKTGQIERTVDREFMEEEARYRTMEKELNNLQREAKNYLDSMRMMSASQARIAETLELFYTNDRTSDSAMAGHAYKSAVEELDNIVSRDLDAPFRATVLEPVGKLCSYFPTVNEGIAKRNKKMLDYDAARSKVRKLQDKPSDDSVKLPRAQQEYDEAKEIFDILNEQYIRELPLLLDTRIPYLDPSFEAMVRCQLRFAEEGYAKLSGVQRYFADNIRDDYANGQLDAQVETVLGEMKELAIYGV
ncbi:BAR adaptor protein Hob3 [Naganishia albida]|nr:BAR adaptor protein Hob3 [Naganishia albida]